MVDQHRVHNPGNWACIKLVIPDGTDTVDPNNVIGAWCVICKKAIAYSKSNIKAVSTNMKKNHMEMYEKAKNEKSPKNEGGITKKIQEGKQSIEKDWKDG